jgi:hypothetical protein
VFLRQANDKYGGNFYFVQDGIAEENHSISCSSESCEEVKENKNNLENMSEFSVIKQEGPLKDPIVGNLQKLIKELSSIKG